MAEPHEPLPKKPNTKQLLLSSMFHKVTFNTREAPETSSTQTPQPKLSNADSELDAETSITAVSVQSTQQETSITAVSVQSTQQECTGSCCDMSLADPFRSTSVQYDFKTETVTSFPGSCKRYFLSKWLTDFPWLMFCYSRKVAFCYYCRHAHSMRIPGTSKSEDAFSANGFGNWKKAVEKFTAHQNSESHRSSICAHHLNKKPSVLAQISRQHSDDLVKRRRMLLKTITSLRFLARQGLPVRGHTEEESNLHQLLQLRAEDVSEMKWWLKEANYQSHDVINELLQIMSHCVLRNILERIKSATFYAIIADETRDESGVEQLCISIRWVDSSDFIVNEDVIGLYEVASTTAVTLVSVINDSLVRCQLPLNFCRGQGYDGAANMSGVLHGVAQQISDEVPAALYVHCFAHSLQLCLQEVAESVASVRDALSLVQQLHKLIRNSPKRMDVFERIAEQVDRHAATLKPLCLTRWTARTSALQAVLQNYEAILEALELFSEESGGVRMEAAGLLSSMERFSTFYGLRVSYLVFCVTEQLSRSLQTKGIDAQTALGSVRACQAYFRSLRQEAHFEKWYSDVLGNAKGKTEEPCLPRRRNAPRQMDEGSEVHQFASPRDFYAQQFHHLLDILSFELDRRFQHKSMKLLAKVEQMLLLACNRELDLSEFDNSYADVKLLYKNDVDWSKLQVQLQMLPDMVKTANPEVKKVTSLSTLTDVFASSQNLHLLFSEVRSLYQMYLTVPLTSATAERTFSTLRRLKNYLRSTMTPIRLNSLMLLHIHKHLTDALNPQEIAAEFTRSNERRHHFFGTFD